MLIDMTEDITGATARTPGPELAYPKVELKVLCRTLGEEVVGVGFAN